MVFGGALLGMRGLSFCIGVGGTTKDDGVAAGTDVAAAELLMWVGTDDARIVAVGDTGVGWNPSIRVVGFADDMIGLSKID